jgi:hypothetical protein
MKEWNVACILHVGAMMARTLSSKFDSAQLDIFKRVKLIFQPAKRHLLWWQSDSQVQASIFRVGMNFWIGLKKCNTLLVDSSSCG